MTNNSFESKSNPHEFEHNEIKSFKFIDKEGAGMQYVAGEEPGTWHIEELESRIPGGGKAVIEEFVKTVGKNQRITASIIEEETNDRLNELGILSHVEHTGEALELTNDATLKTLKIVRVFRGGGITVERVVISPNQYENDDYDIHGHRVVVKLEGTT